MYKFFSLLFAIALCCQGVSAKVMSPDKAKKCVEAEMAAMHASEKPVKRMLGADVTKLVYTKTENGEASVYVFTSTQGGYFMVAANDAVPQRLLAYSENGRFDAKNIPANVALWLSRYSSEVAYAAEHENDEDYTANPMSATIQADMADMNEIGDDDEESGCEGEYDCIKPLVTSRWGQMAPYNALCPVVDGVQCPTGCVATAMAQVMNYYQYPQHGTGSVSFTNVGQKLTCDLENTFFNWSVLQNGDEGRISSSNIEASKAVSTLMYACGTSVGMSYRPTGSSSSIEKGMKALVKNFGYSKSISFVKREYYEDIDWEHMILDELVEGRPVIYAATSAVDGGHAFICDGYDCNGYFHINWGWGGAYEGYFLLSALDPKANNQGFQYNEAAVIGIRPDYDNAPVKTVLAFSGGMNIAEGFVDRSNENATITVNATNGIFNKSVDAVNITTGLKLIGRGGVTRYVASGDVRRLVSGQAFVNYQVKASDFPEIGQWVAVPAVQDENGNWSECLVTRSLETAYTVYCDSKSITLLPQSEDLSVPDDYMVELVRIKLTSAMNPGSRFNMSAKFKNRVNNVATEYYKPMLYMDEVLMAEGSPIYVEIGAKQTLSVEWGCEWNTTVAPGPYKIALVDAYGNLVGTPINAVMTAKMRTIVGIDEVEGDDNSQSIDHIAIYDLNGHLIQYLENDTDVVLQPGTYVKCFMQKNTLVRSQKIQIN